MCPGCVQCVQRRTRSPPASAIDPRVATHPFDQGPWRKVEVGVSKSQIAGHSDKEDMRFGRHEIGVPRRSRNPLLIGFIGVL